jgi:transposase
VSADETSWHVNGEMGWLWIVTTDLLTVYGIREGRGYDEAASLLGADFEGALVRDGWAVYPKFVEAEHQTCLAHLLRRCREMREVTLGRGREVPNLVACILKEALVLRDRHQAGEVSQGELAVGVVELEARVERLLARPAIAHAGNRRLLKHLGLERDHLFTSLRHHDLGVPATNWQAEQGIRPCRMPSRVSGSPLRSSNTIRSSSPVRPSSASAIARPPAGPPPGERPASPRSPPPPVPPRGAGTEQAGEAGGPAGKQPVQRRPRRRPARPSTAPRGHGCRRTPGRPSGTARVPSAAPRSRLHAAAPGGCRTGGRGSEVRHPPPRQAPPSSAAGLRHRHAGWLR